MSRNPSILSNQNVITPSGRIQIALLDHTELPPALSQLDTNTEQHDSEAGEPGTALSRKPTGSSLRHSVRQQINRQKYARYQSSRYDKDDDADRHENIPEGVVADVAPQGRIERGRAKAAKFWRGKKKLGKQDDRDTVLDILYENQRGSFLFGIPRYSSNSLLQIDPQAWQNADFRTSAVDIRNAQVPDPSWEWAWPNWFADMSRDVDEEGWEYSFAFGTQFAWHGTHPWFHSFVRRRRWLRMRVRKDTRSKAKDVNHDLAADYFTIHTGVLSGTDGKSFGQPLQAEEEEELEIPNINSLIKHMAKARLDREKLVAVRAFVLQGGDDVRYLAERMSDVMSLFIYQSSRRQLLTELEHYRDEAAQGKDMASKLEYLRQAADAAEMQAQRFEYWSDLRDMATHGEMHLSKEDARKWQGIDKEDKSAFKSKQAASDPAAELHEHPEHNVKAKQSVSDTDSSGYTTAPSMAASVQQRPSFSTKASSSKLQEDIGSDLERFVTASEGPVSSIKPKQRPNRKSARGKALQLDGVDEDEDTEPMQEVDAESSRVD